MKLVTENRKFLDTLKVCDSEWYDGINALGLEKANVNLRLYCREFLKLFDERDRTDYIGCLINLYNILESNTNKISTDKYLNNYIRYLKDLKLTMSEKVTTIGKLNTLIYNRHIWLSDGLHGLKVIMIVSDCAYLDGNKVILESDRKQSYKFKMNGVGTEVGGIFIKDGKVDYMKVSTTSERIALLARVIKNKEERERENYNLVLVPKLYNMDRNEILENLDKIVNNNKELLDLMVLIECDNRLRDGKNVRKIYRYIRNSEINVSDFYKLIRNTRDVRVILGLFESMIRILKIIKDKTLQKRLKTHILKVLVYKLEDCDDSKFTDVLLEIREHREKIGDDKEWIKEALKILKESNYNTKIINEDDYEDGDIIVIDLDRNRRVFKSKEDEGLKSLLDSHRYLYYHEISKIEPKMVEISFR